MRNAVAQAFCLTGLLIWSLSLSGLASGEEPGPEFCTTGPYVFPDVQVGLANNLPSVRREMAALGLFAKKSGCSLKVVCVLSSDEGAALREARRAAAAICNTARQMLVRHSFRAPRGNPNVTEANASMREAIQMDFVSVEPWLPLGSVLVQVEPRA